VDLCFAPDRPFEPFPHPVVGDAVAQRLARQARFALALSVSTPDVYASFRHAVNVGLTFWECDRFPLDPETARPSVAQANRMDALWVPSTHTRNVFQAAGVRVPIRIIPWPLSVVRRRAGELSHGEVFDLDRRLHSTATLATCATLDGSDFRGVRALMRRLRPIAARAVLSQLRTSPEAIPLARERAFLCVAQDCPRKALRLLLSEWLEFKRRPEGAPWSLLLKSSPQNHTTPAVELVVHFWRQVQALKRQLGVRRASVYLWTGDLTSSEYYCLLALTFGHIAPGLGEGFCGPAAAALGLGKPLIAPRHTAFDDYLPPDYPYCFVTRPALIHFADEEAHVYDPGSSWQVPEPFAIADALSRLVLDTVDRRSQLCNRAQARVRHWCRPARVRRLLEAEVARFADRVGKLSPSVPA
jgi:hypothetical protein